MVSRIVHLGCLLLVLAALPVQGGIDFKPLPHATSFEGVQVQDVAFQNDGLAVVYQPPGDWALEGGGSRLRLTPREGSYAEGQMEARPLNATGQLDGELLTKLRAEMTAALPKDARQVEWEEVETNPLMLNQHETRRLTVKYSAFAQRFKATTIVCNFAQEQLHFRFSARESDFDRMFEAFRRSLYSFQGMP